MFYSYKYVIMDSVYMLSCRVILLMKHRTKAEDHYV